MKPQVVEGFLLLLEQGWWDDHWGCRRGRPPPRCWAVEGIWGLMCCGNLGWFHFLMWASVASSCKWG